MTHPESFGLAPPPAAPTAYDYVGGNPELDQLLAMEDNLYAKSKELEKALADVKDRIKVALTSVTRPDSTPFERYRIALPGQVARVLKWRTQRRINTAALKAEQPGIYQAYSRESGAWFLERERRS